MKMIRLLLAMFCLITALISQSQDKTIQPQQITEISIVPDDSIIVEAPDKMPEYIGGQNALMKKLSENLIYPSECAEAEIQGKVVVKFVVNTNGKIGNIEVVKSVHPALDAEAVRVVALLDNWIPGKMNGENVRVYYTLPISFKLQGDSSHLPDFSKWSFFELRDSLIDFLTDLYKDVPREGYSMIKAQVLNDYIGVKCALDYPTLPDEIKESLENGDEYDTTLIIGKSLAALFPFEYRCQLCYNNIKLTYIIRDQSNDKEYSVVIEQDIWLPETWEFTEFQIVED